MNEDSLNDSKKCSNLGSKFVIARSEWNAQNFVEEFKRGLQSPDKFKKTREEALKILHNLPPVQQDLYSIFMVNLSD
jgi:hypothetical protein